MGGAAASIVERLERRQVPLYLAALALGAVAALVVPSVATPAGVLVPVVLGLLIYVTFLGIPLGSLRRAVRDGRFVLTLLIVNFVLAPPVAWLCSRWLADTPALLLGALLVLLCPCVDYVVSFTGLAGGDRERLLASTPLLMLVQACLLPLWLWLFTGDEAAGLVPPAPFIHSFVWMILVPLVVAGLTQWWAGRPNGVGRVGAATSRFLSGTMVPLMMLTLALVTAAHAGRLGAHAALVVRVVPVYLAFAAAMFGLSWLATAAVRLPVAQRRAVVFSGVTRNSLVVLPLALAASGSHIPADEQGLTALAVVSQTLVELVLMVIMVRFVPRMLRRRSD